MDAAALIRQQTVRARPFLVPELELDLATSACPLWTATEEDLERLGLPAPYWAFTWAGGEALARHVLDHPELVRGKRVLDFGSGSGVVGLAAARAGALAVTAADIDPVACEAIRLNAALNGLELETTTEDLLGRSEVPWEVILSGDASYDRELAERLRRWLIALGERGHTVLIGDPGRGYLEAEGLRVVGRYEAPADIDADGTNLKTTLIFTVEG